MNIELCPRKVVALQKSKPLSLSKHDLYVNANYVKLTLKSIMAIILLMLTWICRELEYCHKNNSDKVVSVSLPLCELGNVD